MIIILCWSQRNKNNPHDKCQVGDDDNNKHNDDDGKNNGDDDEHNDDDGKHNDDDDEHNDDNEWRKTIIISHPASESPHSSLCKKEKLNKRLKK